MKLENRITELLNVIKGKDVSRAEMVASLEWLGKEFEEEIDRVKEDKRQDQDDDKDPQTD